MIVFAGIALSQIGTNGNIAAAASPIAARRSNSTRRIAYTFDATPYRSVVAEKSCTVSASGIDGTVGTHPLRLELGAEASRQLAVGKHSPCCHVRSRRGTERERREQEQRDDDEHRHQRRDAVIERREAFDGTLRSQRSGADDADRERERHEQPRRARNELEPADAVRMRRDEPERPCARRPRESASRCPDARAMQREAPSPAAR